MFSVAAMNKTRDNIKRAIENKGYAFSEVELLPVIDADSKQVFVRLNVIPKQRVYVRRIVFVANNITIDSVVRREFRQYEGALYLPAKLALSEKRLRRVGFFTSVDTDIQRVNDQLVDVVVRFNEKRTGSFNAQLGYSDQLGVSYKLAVSEGNLFGYGYAASISAETNNNVESANISFTDPYFDINGNSLSGNLGYSRTDIEGREYVTDSINLGISYGVPINEDLRLNYSYNYQNYHLNCSASFTLCNDYVAENSAINVFNLFGISAVYDLRNRSFFPSQGSYHVASIRSELPNSEFGLYEMSLHSNFYNHFDAHQRFTMRSKLRVSLIDSLSNTVPYYKNLFLGGQNSVRGFGFGSLGPTFDEESGIATTTPLGGNFLSQANVDLYLPLTAYDEFNPNDDNVRLNLFIDSGYTYPTINDFDISQWRVSAGTSIIYFTPLGILSVYYAVPVKSESSDIINNFGFSIANSL